MKVTQITVSGDLKLTKNYQSAGAQVSLTASLEDGENVHDAHKVLTEQIQNWLEQDVDILVRKL